LGFIEKDDNKPGVLAIGVGVGLGFNVDCLLFDGEIWVFHAAEGVVEGVGAEKGERADIRNICGAEDEAGRGDFVKAPGMGWWGSGRRHNEKISRKLSSSFFA